MWKWSFCDSYSFVINTRVIFIIYVMRILHFILGKANKDRPNGVNQVIAGLCKYSIRNDAQVKVIGIANSAAFEGEVITRDGFEVKVYSRWSRKLLRDLKSELEWCDILHLHGVYNIHNLFVSKIALKHSVPYVVTLHDGLSPVRAVAKRKLLKWFFNKILQRNHLEAATALHVLTNEESTDAISMCTPKELMLVPNGIDLEDYTFSQNNNPIPAIRTASNAKLTIGYLGRISPEKNLCSLVDAVNSLVEECQISLKIAGPKSAYLDEVLGKVGKHNNVEWVGPVYGDDKINFVRSVDLFIHPALCDVFSIVAMEVMAIGTPLLITRTSNCSYFYDRNAFFMCEPTSFGLRLGVLNAIKHKGEWPEIVKNGRFLIQDIFNWDAASKSLLNEYSRVLSVK
jgi:glycosyltransferase involved in cell wall biosynthesis